MLEDLVGSPSSELADEAEVLPGGAAAIVGLDLKAVQSRFLRCPHHGSKITAQATGKRKQSFGLEKEEEEEIGIEEKAPAADLINADILLRVFVDVSDPYRVVFLFTNNFHVNLVSMRSL